METDKRIDQEAAALCRYLVGAQPSEHISKLYRAVIRRERQAPSGADARILAYALAHPNQIVYLDSALAVVRPSAALRQRLYAMFAITEATPEYAERYLPVARPPVYILAIGLHGVRAVCRAMVGLVLLHTAGRAR
jgi:hypothetical protein